MTWNTFLRSWIRSSLKGLVIGYRYSLAAVLGGQCRFYPTCSQYAMDVLDSHPPLRALSLIARRLLSCHPGHPGGVDLVPEPEADGVCRGLPTPDGSRS